MTSSETNTLVLAGPSVASTHGAKNSAIGSPKCGGRCTMMNQNPLITPYCRTQSVLATPVVLPWRQNCPSAGGNSTGTSRDTYFVEEQDKTT